MYRSQSALQKRKVEPALFRKSDCSALYELLIMLEAKLVVCLGVDAIGIRPPLG